MASLNVIFVLLSLLLQFGRTYPLNRGEYESGVDLELRGRGDIPADEDHATSTSTVAIVSSVAAFTALVMIVLTSGVCVYCCVVKYKMCTPIYDPIHNPPPNCRLYTYDYMDVDRYSPLGDETTPQPSRGFITGEILEAAPPSYHQAVIQCYPEANETMQTHQISTTGEGNVSSGDDELPKYEDVMDSSSSDVSRSQASSQDPAWSDNMSEEGSTYEGSSDENLSAHESSCRSESFCGVDEIQSIQDATPC